MPPTEKFTTNQQELAHLAQHAHKEYILQHNPHKTLESASVASIEQYARAQAQEFLHETAILPEHTAEALVLKLKPEAHDKKIEELFGIMLEKGIKNALDVVKKIGDSHLEDDFHRFLVQYLHTTGAIPGLKEHSALHKELEHSLFTVTLHPQDSTQQDFSVFIQAMKQFYIGMLSLCENSKDHYTLELAVQNSGRDIALYASVPRIHEQTFEKLVNSYYPGASIEIATDDYNIFSDSGNGIAAAYATLAEPAIFPLSTDDTFSHDPLAALIGSLSKLESVGEGAAIQVIITNDKNNSNSLYSSIIKSAENGDGEVKKMYQETTEDLLPGIAKGIFSFFDTSTPKEDSEKKIDARGIEFAQLKNNSQSLLAGIRIIATAPTLSRATAMLSTVKATFAQFALVGSNSIVWKDVKTSALHEFAKDFSFRTIESDELLSLS
ncbi:hypothetical protein K2Q02_00580, partial [Patescibacteria group bacterium]|nr:hypothetical protein [Patescibacteria group bacterium]